MTESLEERKLFIWRECENRWGFSVPEEARSNIERDKLGGIYDEEGLENLEYYLKDLDWAVYLAIATGKHKLDNDSKSPKTRYNKPFQRRLYLVNFVSSIVKNPRRIMRDEWENACREWNIHNPSDTMTTPVMRVEYQRAKAEPAVQSAYFNKYYPHYNQYVTKLASFAEDTDWAEERIREELGSTALRKGELAMASTADFTTILLEQQPRLENKDTVDFSKSMNQKEVNNERPHTSKE